MLPPHVSRGSRTRRRFALITILPLAALLAPAPVHAQESGHGTIAVGSQWPGARPGQVDISDDGRYVVFQSTRGEGWRLFLHEMGQQESREIVGLGETPYFGHISPNGQWLLFGKKGWIWKSPLAGGGMTLIYTNNNFKTWETDETFLVSKGSNGIWRVRADGSRRDEKVASVDSSTGATNYGRPSRLPGGRGVLVSVGFNTGTDLRKIGIVSLPGGKLTILDEYGVNPRYAESGHILYTQGNTLKAIPFDLGSLKAVGPGVTVVEGVEVYSNQASQFDISRTGTLIYVTGPSELNRIWPRTLVWVDRQGRETAFDTPAEKTYGAIRLSPNGRFVAAEVGSGLHLFDRQSGSWTVLAEAGSAGAPVWAADGNTLFYSRAGVLGRQKMQPAGAWEEIWKGEQQFWGFSLAADGNQLLGTEWNVATGLWRLTSVALGTTPARATPLPGGGDLIRRNPAISPDGRWLAYVEKSGGLDRVFVRAYPSGGPALLVSEGTAGEAAEPIWGASSSELFYRDGAHMVSVELQTSPGLGVRHRTPLFSTRDHYNYLNTFAAVHDYDPRTDRFLMSRNAIPNLPGTDIQVIENAFELLKRLAPRK